MKNSHKKANHDAWENRNLGASEKHVRKVSSKREKALDEDLGMQTISIRLQKSLIDALKQLAAEDGIGYQPYVRQLLMRHVREIDLEKREKRKRKTRRVHTSSY